MSTQASGLATPGLSPSTNTSPALQRIQTPQDELPAFDLGQPAMMADQGEKQGLAFNGSVLIRMPECWGHRGASATYPENTKASFIEACKQGADGIETDIHITSDNVLVLFHDPKLDRTTDGTGRIREQPWHGKLEHVRTRQSPAQPIPLFTEVLEIMLEKGNERVKLNLDCKVDNDADKLFSLVKDAIARYPHWQTKLAPRIVLGLWHPKFLGPASTHLPYLPRYAISMSLADSRRFFWPSVQGFSIYYEVLASAAGQQFLAECKAAGKGVCAWTVNTKEGMRECVRWGVGSCITDKPQMWTEVKAEFQANPIKSLQPTIQTYVLPFLSSKAYWFNVEREARKEMDYLEKEGGRFVEWDGVEIGLRVVAPGKVSTTL